MQCRQDNQDLGRDNGGAHWLAPEEPQKVRAPCLLRLLVFKRVLFADFRARCRNVNCVCFSEDGKLIASGSNDTTVKIWDASTGACQSTLTVDANVSSLDFSPCGSKIAAACNLHNREQFSVKILTTSGLGCTDGTTSAWDVAVATQEAEFKGDNFSFTDSSGDQQTVGQYVVTKKDDLVLVYLKTHMAEGEPAAGEENKKAIAFFRAPGDVQTLECAGDRIAVGCENEGYENEIGDRIAVGCQKLHLQAKWLVVA